MFKDKQTELQNGVTEKWCPKDAREGILIAGMMTPADLKPDSWVKHFTLYYGKYLLKDSKMHTISNDSLDNNEEQYL